MTKVWVDSPGSKVLLTFNKNARKWSPRDLETKTADLETITADLETMIWKL